MSATGTFASSVMHKLTKPLAILTGMRWGYAALISLAIAAIVAVAVQNYRAVDRELTAVALLRRDTVVQLIATTISEKFGRLIDVAVSLATRVRFRELVADGKWAEAAEILRAVPRDLPFIERLFLADVDGALMADVPELPGIRRANVAHRDWYQGVRSDWRPHVSSVYRRVPVPQLNVFAVAVPIRAVDGSVLGILVLQVRVDTFFEWAKRVDTGTEGFVYVVDSKGQLAFDSKSKDLETIRDFSGVPAVQRLRRGEQGVEIAYDPLEREDIISAYAPVAGYGWGVVTRQSTRSSAAFEAKNEQLNLLLTAYGLTLALCVLATYLASRIMLQRRQVAEDHRIKAELEHAVTERTAQLEAINKELEGFSYSVSHDLRSPLRAIDGFSRIVMEDYGGKFDDEGRRLLGVIRDSSQKMGQLIDDLLEFSRLGRKPLATAEIDMTRLVEEVTGDLHMPGGKPTGLVLGALPPASGDPTLVKQVWVNLLGNAVKFSSKREQAVIEVSGRENGAESIYCVKDNGAGFDMKYSDKLFGVFQRLHSAQEFDGTGVGLAIVQRVVARHGGRVWAEGEVNKGAAFFFSLPKGRQDGHI